MIIIPNIILTTFLPSFSRSNWTTFVGTDPRWREHKKKLLSSLRSTIRKFSLLNEQQIKTLNTHTEKETLENT